MYPNEWHTKDDPSWMIRFLLGHPVGAGGSSGGFIGKPLITEDKFREIAVALVTIDMRSRKEPDVGQRETWATVENPGEALLRWGIPSWQMQANQQNAEMAAKVIRKLIPYPRKDLEKLYPHVGCI